MDFLIAVGIGIVIGIIAAIIVIAIIGKFKPDPDTVGRSKWN